MRGLLFSMIAMIVAHSPRFWAGVRRNPGRVAAIAAVLLILGTPGRGDDRTLDSGAKAGGGASVGATASAQTSETDAARADTNERLNALSSTATIPSADTAAETRAGDSFAMVKDSNGGKTEVASAPSPATTSLSGAVRPSPIRAVLDERLHLLDEYDRIRKELVKVTHPETTPEHQAALAGVELRQLEAFLKRAAKDPESLLPPLFRGSAIDTSRTLPLEMKAALESTSNDVKKWKLEVEALNGQIKKSHAEKETRRALRDKYSHSLTTLKARREEFESAVTDAVSAESRQLARERLTNFEWETKLEALKLELVEAQIAAENKLADVRALTLQIDRAHIKIGTTTLAQMESHYSKASLEHERDLKNEAALEDEKARLATDPVEKYRHQRSADLLRLEILVLKYEQLEATNPSPSFEEQKNLADHADDDFARITELVADGSVSRLDAVRLNNEFRRIGPERDRLIKNELAIVEAQIQFYESVLTGVEIDLMQGGLHDLERDMVRERLSPDRYAEWDLVTKALDHRNRGLLVRQRDALDQLAKRGGHTLTQVLRRLDYLDREYGFIRTSIFWVRDQEPIGLSILDQQMIELRRLAKGLVRLVQESVKGGLWAHPSGEFLIMVLAALALPIGLLRLRTLLKVFINREMAQPRA